MRGDALTAEWLNNTLSVGDKAKNIVKNSNTDQSSSYRVRLNGEYSIKKTARVVLAFVLMITILPKIKFGLILN